MENVLRKSKQEKWKLIIQQGKLPTDIERVNTQGKKKFKPKPVK